MHMSRLSQLLDAPQGCVISMNTPAVLTFLHMLAAVLVQWILTAYDVLEAPHISMYSLKGSAMPTVLHALQVRGCRLQGSRSTGRQQLQ